MRIKLGAREEHSTTSQQLIIVGCWGWQPQGKRWFAAEDQADAVKHQEKDKVVFILWHLGEWEWEEAKGDCALQYTRWVSTPFKSSQIEWMNIGSFFYVKLSAKRIWVVFMLMCTRVKLFHPSLAHWNTHQMGPPSLAQVHKHIHLSGK